MKRLILFLTILFCPLNVFAYSEYIIPGGDTIGVDVETDGVMIIGFYKIDGKYNRGKPSLSGGDYILKINDIEVFSVDDMTNVIEQALDKRSIEVTFKRNGEIKKTKLPLVLSEGKYKTGLYVKSSIKGIGTLTYIDPETGLFGALGHEINESSTNSIVEIKSGVIFENRITGIDKSKVGVAGSKLAEFNYNNQYGTILKNTKYGIFGTYNSEFPNRDLVKVSDVKLGLATFKTVVDGDKITEHLINITAINENRSTKNISFEILDEELINKTGGVVQGMSGSPIMQDGNIVGVLTHVVVDNPTSGYGLLIKNMLSMGEN